MTDPDLDEPGSTRFGHWFHLVRGRFGRASRAVRRWIFSNPWPVGGLTCLLGGGMIAAGWIMDNQGYGSSLLQNAGVAVLLLVPLFAVERRFSSSLGESARKTTALSRDVASVEQRITPAAPVPVQDVAEELGALLDAAGENDDALAEAARAATSIETVGALFTRACQLNALSEHGVRVQVAHQWERARFRWAGMPECPEDLDDGVIRVSIERVEGSGMNASIDWQPGESALEMLAALAEAWTQAGEFPGKATFIKADLVGSLIDTLDLAIRARRTRGSDDQLSPLIEKLGESWVMTDFGLEHLPFSYYIKREELVEDLDDWRRHMWEKTWVLEEDEQAKQGGALDFWMISKTANLFFANHRLSG